MICGYLARRPLLVPSCIATHPPRGDGELWKVRVLRAPPQLRAFCSEMRVSAVELDRFTVTDNKQPLSLTHCPARFRSSPHRLTVSRARALGCAGDAPHAARVR